MTASAFAKEANISLNARPVVAVQLKNILNKIYQVKFVFFREIKSTVALQ